MKIPHRLVRLSLASGLMAIAAGLAQPALAQDVPPSPTPSAGEGSGGGEIVVTATRRETTLQTTPAAISVLGGDTIAKRGLVGMEDYLASLPGVSYADRGAGQNTITIRGIGQGDQLSANTPVGSYFGEVPVTGLGPPLNGNGAGNADLKMVDIARVEVLRGPQGTLYGSGSMGGTLRVIPNAPDLHRVGGSIKGTFSNTGRLGGNNYSVEAVVNAPVIEDKLAVRVAGYRFFDDGYIDNVAVSQPTPNVDAAVALGAVRRDRKHVGANTTSGVRAVALWKPVDDLSITLTHLYQGIRQDGFQEVQTGLNGDYLQSRVRVGEGGQDDEYVNLDLNITNAVVEYDAGWGTFLNSTSIIKNRGVNDIEFTFYGDPLLAVGSKTNADKNLFVNEFRFASKFKGPFQLIAGGYYENRRTSSHAVTRYNGTFNPVPAVPASNFELDQDKNYTRQLAAFGEASFTPWDPLTLTVGARYFKFNLGIPVAVTDGVARSTQGKKAGVDGVNWKVNLAWKASRELFFYAQWSQGFRQPLIQRPVLPQYDADHNGLVEFTDGIQRKVKEGILEPDRVNNYEVGMKFKALGGRVRGGLTGFYTKWTGIPIIPALTSFGGQGLYFNLGKATSKGVEFEISGEITHNLYADFSASWVQTTLAEAAPGLGPKGADLPGSADHNLKAGLERRFDVGGHQAFVRGDWTYVSEYYSTFAETGTPAGGYSLFDANAGINIDRFKIGVFAKNLANRKDFTWVDNIFGPAAGRAYRLRPRTIGVSLGVDLF